MVSLDTIRNPAYVLPMAQRTADQRCSATALVGRLLVVDSFPFGCAAVPVRSGRSARCREVLRRVTHAVGYDARHRQARTIEGGGPVGLPAGSGGPCRCDALGVVRVLDVRSEMWRCRSSFPWSW